MNFKAFPPELRANLSGNHGRNRKCSFSQIRNLLKTNTSRISGLPKKWQTGGRDKCLSAAEPSEVLKVWLIRIPSFCVDDSNSVPILPLPIIFFCTIGPGSSIHKLYDLRSPNSQPSELGNLTREPRCPWPPKMSQPRCPWQSSQPNSHDGQWFVKEGLQMLQKCCQSV